MNVLVMTVAGCRPLKILLSELVVGEMLQHNAGKFGHNKHVYS